MTLADVMLSDMLASSAFSGFHGGMGDSSCPTLMDPRLPLPCLPRRSCLSAPQIPHATVTRQKRLL